MSTTLITGANRGIGLTFCKQYLEDGWQVIACARQSDTPELLELSKQYGSSLQIYALDVADITQIEALAKLLTDTAIDVLINNAGVYPESGFGDTHHEDWVYSFKINTMAPYYMAQAFIKHVAASHHKKIVTLSSKMGSIDDNGSGGEYIYRTGKTAVNMVMKSLSIDLKPYGIACCALHPGWVLTDMGGPNALINTEHSVSGMRKVISELNINNAGRFIAYDGKEIPW